MMREPHLLLIWEGDSYPLEYWVELTDDEATTLEQRLDVLASGFDDSNGRLLRYHLIQLKDPEMKHDELLSIMNSKFAQSERKEYNIYINGEKHTLSHPTLAYEELVSLAGYRGNPTAVYHHRSHKSGTLYKGKTVTLSDDMQFTVVHTNSA